MVENRANNQKNERQLRERRGLQIIYLLPSSFLRQEADSDISISKIVANE